MSRFKNEMVCLEAHIKTLRLGGRALFALALVLASAGGAPHAT